MAETIYREQGGAIPGGQPPAGVDEDMARAEEALKRAQEADPDKQYGRLEHNLVGPAGTPSPLDHGRGENADGGGGAT